MLAGVGGVSARAGGVPVGVGGVPAGAGGVLGATREKNDAWQAL